MIKFYYTPRSSASRVHVALEELGVPYEKIRIHLDKGEQKKPDFLDINPNGKVPALVDGDVRVFESLACLFYLGARYGVDKGLWPKLGTREQGDALSWSVWGNTEVAPCILDHALHGTDLHWALPKEKRAATVAEMARETWRTKMTILDKHLDGREWMLGKSFSLTDVAVGMLVGMGPMMCNLPMDWKHVGAWLGRMQARPAFGKVFSEQ